MTVATLVDRLKINGSLARRCLKDLEEKGQIKQVVSHSKMKIYSTLRPPCGRNQREMRNQMLTRGPQLAPLPLPSKHLPQKHHDGPGRRECDFVNGGSLGVTVIRAWLRLWDWGSFCSSVGVARGLEVLQILRLELHQVMNNTATSPCQGWGMIKQSATPDLMS